MSLFLTPNRGEVSKPIETAEGWYLIKTGEKTPAVQKKFQEVKDNLAIELFELAKKEQLKEVLTKLQKSATIEG